MPLLGVCELFENWQREDRALLQTTTEITFTLEQPKLWTF